MDEKQKWPSGNYWQHLEESYRFSEFRFLLRLFKSTQNKELHLVNKMFLLHLVKSKLRKVLREDMETKYGIWKMLLGNQRWHKLKTNVMCNNVIQIDTEAQTYHTRRKSPSASCYNEENIPLLQENILWWEKTSTYDLKTSCYYEKNITLLRYMHHIISRKWHSA